MIPIFWYQNYVSLTLHLNYMGQNMRKTVHIPRIPLIPTEKNNPIIFKRIQFPIKVCFALTMTRAQSQTFKYMGIDFTNPPFTHGHLYTSLTRVTTPRNLHLYFPTPSTTVPNPVYTEVLSLWIYVLYHFIVNIYLLLNIKFVLFIFYCAL